jgi:hypothetical protein
MSDEIAKNLLEDKMCATCTDGGIIWMIDGGHWKCYKKDDNGKYSFIARKRSTCKEWKKKFI